MSANGLRTSDFRLSNEVAGFGSSVQGGIISFCYLSVCSCLYLQPAQAADVEGPYGFMFVFWFCFGVYFKIVAHKGVVSASLSCDEHLSGPVDAQSHSHEYAIVWTENATK